MKLLFVVLLSVSAAIAVAPFDADEAETTTISDNIVADDNVADATREKRTLGVDKNYKKDVEIKTKLGTTIKISKSMNYNDGGAIVHLPMLIDSLGAKKVRVLQHRQQKHPAVTEPTKASEAGTTRCSDHETGSDELIGMCGQKIGSAASAEIVGQEIGKDASISLSGQQIGNDESIGISDKKIDNVESVGVGGQKIVSVASAEIVGQEIGKDASISLSGQQIGNDGSIGISDQKIDNGESTGMGGQKIVGVASAEIVGHEIGKDASISLSGQQIGIDASIGIGGHKIVSETGYNGMSGPDHIYIINPLVPTKEETEVDKLAQFIAYKKGLLHEKIDRIGVLKDIIDYHIKMKKQKLYNAIFNKSQALKNLIATKEAQFIEKVSRQVMEMSKSNKIGSPCCPNGPCCPDKLK